MTDREEFEKWAEDYALDFEPLTRESVKQDCLAAWKAGAASKQAEIKELSAKLDAALDSMEDCDFLIDQLKARLEFWGKSANDWKLAYAARGGDASNSGIEELTAIKQGEYQRGLGDIESAAIDAYNNGWKESRDALTKELEGQEPVAEIAVDRDGVADDFDVLKDLPTGVHKLYAKPFTQQKPLSDVDLSLMAHNDCGDDWNDLRYKECWLEGYSEGGRAVEAAHGIKEN